MVGGADHYEANRSCGHYHIPRACKTVDGHKWELNSGLLVFQRAHHQHILDEPCSKWSPIKHTHGLHFDQPLFNAMLIKHQIPTLDLNSFGSNPGDCREKRESKTDCFVLQGLALRFADHRHDSKYRQRLCVAHVTRGAYEMRGKFLCDLQAEMRCEYSGLAKLQQHPEVRRGNTRVQRDGKGRGGGG